MYFCCILYRNSENFCGQKTLIRYIPQNFSVEQAKVVHLYSSCCIMASLLVSLLQNKPLFQAICPGCLWARGNRWLLSRVQRLAGLAGDRGLLSRLETPTGTKGWSFIPVGGSNRDKRPLSPAGPASRWSRDKNHLLSRA